MSLSPMFSEVLFSANAYSQMIREADSRWPLETGGILLGTITEGKVFIQCVVGPGPLAKHSPVSFTRDGAYAQRELERLVDEFRGSVDYVGEWHSHTLNIGPSGRDRISMAFIATSPAYDMPQPLLILCLPSKLLGGRTWKAHGYRHAENNLFEVQTNLDLWTDEATS